MMINKKIQSIMVASMLTLWCIWITQAQTSGNQDNLFQTGEESKIVTQSIKGETVNDLNIIGAKFCNDGIEQNKLTNHLAMQLQPGQKKEICMLFFNISSDKAVDVKFWFSSTNINKDGWISCDDDMTTKNDFSKMIDQTNVTEFVIEPQTQVVKRVKMYVPKEYTGNNIYGCLGYKINKEETMDPGQVFLLVFRKTAPMQIIVTWGVYQFWWRDDIKDVYATNRNILLKIIIGILAIRLVLTIVKTGKKKDIQQAKKQITKK